MTWRQRLASSTRPLSPHCKVFHADVLLFRWLSVVLPCLAPKVQHGSRTAFTSHGMGSAITEPKLRRKFAKFSTAGVYEDFSNFPRAKGSGCVASTVADMRTSRLSGLLCSGFTLDRGPHSPGFFCKLCFNNKHKRSLASHHIGTPQLFFSSRPYQDLARESHPTQCACNCARPPNSEAHARRAPCILATKSDLAPMIGIQMYRQRPQLLGDVPSTSEANLVNSALATSSLAGFCQSAACGDEGQTSAGRNLCKHLGGKLLNASCT